MQRRLGDRLRASRAGESRAEARLRGRRGQVAVGRQRPFARAEAVHRHLLGGDQAAQPEHRVREQLEVGGSALRGLLERLGPGRGQVNLRAVLQQQARVHRGGDEVRPPLQELCLLGLGEAAAVPGVRHLKHADKLALVVVEGQQEAGRQAAVEGVLAGFEQVRAVADRGAQRLADAHGLPQDAPAQRVLINERRLPVSHREQLPARQREKKRREVAVRHLRGALLDEPERVRGMRAPEQRREEALVLRKCLRVRVLLQQRRLEALHGALQPPAVVPLRLPQAAHLLYVVDQHLRYVVIALGRVQRHPVHLARRPPGSAQIPSEPGDRPPAKRAGRARGPPDREDRPR